VPFSRIQRSECIDHNSKFLCFFFPILASIFPGCVDRLDWTNNDGFTISTNKSFLDIEVIHNFLSNDSYWVKGIAKELVEASIGRFSGKRFF
jgi:hypothetical protein